MNITLEAVIEALQKSWAKDTCYEETEWSEDNPARGQCVVSSLVLQDYFGGELLRYKVSGDGIDETHYCNTFDNGTLMDVTASQYIQPVTFVVAPADLKSYFTIREKRLADGHTRHRYELLLSRVEAYLNAK
jgi:hypothetical protein